MYENASIVRKTSMCPRRVSVGIIIRFAIAGLVFDQIVILLDYKWAWGENTSKYR